MTFVTFDYGTTFQ